VAVPASTGPAAPRTLSPIARAALQSRRRPAVCRGSLLAGSGREQSLRPWFRSRGTDRSCIGAEVSYRLESAPNTLACMGKKQALTRMDTWPAPGPGTVHRAGGMLHHPAPFLSMASSSLLPWNR